MSAREISEPDDLRRLRDAELRDGSRDAINTIAAKAEVSD